MAFPEKFITELTERSDIVDVVSSYVRLSKRSGSNQFGLCPFHSEKTPSFSVSADKQIYHCFGCGKGGGVISFIMDVENLSFPEAVEFLAKRAGMQMPEEEHSGESKKKARMLALNKDAARFFYEQLGTPAGAAAVEYMIRRGISPQVAKRFGLGAAPDTWDAMRTAMRNKGYSDFEMFDAGLVKRGKNGGFYDAFRNRLMFPIIDVRGNVIGFSGRILGEGEPKYLNSPETLVFNKSRNLFALNLAKKSKSGYIILSEGNIDVVALHQAGFDSAVASLGTSLTPEQARLISRYTKQLVIAYDGDSAGFKASQRAIGILEQLDVKVKVLRLRDAKDPDEYIKRKGPEAFRKLIEGSETQLDYKLKNIQDKYDLTVREQKIAFAKEAIEMAAKIPSEVVREVISAEISEISGIKEDVIRKDIEIKRKTLLNAAQRTEMKIETKPEKLVQPAAKSIKYEDTESAVAEEGLIRLLYLDNELGKKQGLPHKEDFSSPVLAKIYGLIVEAIDDNRHVTVDTLAAALEKDEISLLVAILQKPEILKRSEQSLRDYIDKIKDRKQIRAGKPDLKDLQKQLQKTKGYGR